VGLIFRRFVGAALVPLGFATLLHAAPMLRLVNTAVVPVPLPAGANGGTQIVEAYNAGDGSLSLSLSVPPSVTWIAPSVGSSRACTTTTAAATCIPLQLALNTSALAAGTYTATVTVSGAAGVVDAPQTIAVTVRIGGLTVYVAPGTTSDVSFSTNSPLKGSATTQDGNHWLSLALNGEGSFLFTYPYSVHLAPPATMAQGAYNGTLVTSGSTFAPDNQTIPVALHITTQPIAQASPSQVTARLAQNATAIVEGIALANLGQGSLTVGAVTSTTTDGGSWLTAAPSSGGATITLTPGTLAPGYYTGSVSIASNAANGSVSVPVSFQVVAVGAPLVYYQGVVDNAVYGSFGAAVAPGDIVALFGEQLGSTQAPGVPPPTQLGGATVLVNGRAAPLYYSSYGQINLEIPLETAVGTAQVQVQRDGLTGNTVSLQVASRAPRLLLLGGSGFGAIQNSKDYSLPAPVGYFGSGATSHPAQVGDYLVIYAIGLGPTNPAVGTDVAAPSSEPLARLTTCPASPPCVAPTVEFGTGFLGAISATPVYAGLSPFFVGLYQVNVAIPAGVPSGNVAVSLVFPDSVTNSALIAVQ
jgi:uncharacterized protein (TIGR03437 family)